MKKKKSQVHLKRGKKAFDKMKHHFYTTHTHTHIQNLHRSHLHRPYESHTDRLAADNLLNDLKLKLV